MPTKKHSIKIATLIPDFLIFRSTSRHDMNIHTHAVVLGVLLHFIWPQNGEAQRQSVLGVPTPTRMLPDKKLDPATEELPLPRPWKNDDEVQLTLPSPDQLFRVESEATLLNQIRKAGLARMIKVVCAPAVTVLTRNSLPWATPAALKRWP